MKYGLALLLLTLLGACAKHETPPQAAPVVVEQGSLLKPYIGQRVQVRGYLLDRAYKGYPSLWEDRTKTRLFLVYFPDRIDWRANLDREVVVVGIVKEIPPFTEEQRKPGNIPQGYPSGVMIISAESLN